MQCDFNLPDRFDLSYRDNEGKDVRPIMVHRAIFGSLERFFAILLESVGGALPLWLAPMQLRLLPVTDEAREYCKAVMAKAKKRGLRCEVDPGKDRLNKQIRNAEQQRVPLMCVVGEQETSTGKLAVRARGRGDLGKIDVDTLFDMLGEVEEISALDVDAFEKPPAPVDVPVAEEA